MTDGYGRQSSDTLVVKIDPPSNPEPNQPLAIRKAISGNSSVVVLLSNGSLWGKGSNYNGVLGNGTTDSTSKWLKLANSKVKDVALSLHSLRVFEDGSLHGSGTNDSGQLGTDSITATSTNIPILPSGVSKVEANSKTSLLLKEDGSVWTMGDNPGNGSTQALFHPTLLYDDEVVDISLAASRIFAIKSDGSAWGSGNTNFGALGDTNIGEFPVQIISSGITSIRGGVDHTLLLRDDGALLGLGRSTQGQLGFRSIPGIEEPRELISDNVISIEAGSTSSYVIKSDGSLWVSGRDGQGGLGLGPNINRSINEFTKAIDSGVVSVSAGQPTIVLMDDGSLWGMGNNVGGAITPRLSENANIYYPTLMTDPTGQCGAYAGMDTIIKDTDNDSRETVVLDAYSSSAPWNIASAEWTWPGGNAEGMKSIAALNVGTNPITLTTTSVDGTQSSDTANIIVLPDDGPLGDFYQWLLSHFDQNAIDSWTDGIFFADPDLDGINNLDEWVLDFDPSDPSSGIEISFLPELENNILELRPASDNIEYRIWSSTDLKNWVEISPISSEVDSDTLKVLIEKSHGPYLRASMTASNEIP